MQRSAASRRIETALVHPVLIQTALLSGTGRILNLSRGGAYVTTSISILPCAHAYIHIPVPEKRRFVKLEAIAVWENPGLNETNELPRGYGFRFIRVSRETRMEIQSLMDQGYFLETTPGPNRSLPSSIEPMDALSEIMLGFKSGNHIRRRDSSVVYII
jgi:hypothetical protein